MQIDSVSLQSLYSVRLTDNGRIQGEDREKLRNSPDATKNPASSPTNLEKPGDLKDLLASNVTLDQLLVKDTSITKVPEDDGDIHALSEEIQKEMRIKVLAWRIVEYERERRNEATRRAVESGRYKAAADEKIDDLLGTVNALLKDAELTSEQSEALRIFNSQVNQVKDGFDPFYYDKEHRVYGYSTDRMFAGLQSAFDTLTESFNSVMESTPALKRELENLFAAKFVDVQSSMKDALGVPDLTKEDITSLFAKYIGTYAETEEQKMEDQQFVKDFMPEIIEKIEHYMQDFLHCNVTYS